MLAEIEIGTQTLRHLLRARGDVLSPAYTANGERIILHVNYDGERQVLALNRTSKALQMIGPLDGVGTFVGSIRDSDTLFIAHNGRRTPLHLDPTTLLSPELLASLTGSQHTPSGRGGQRVTITSSGGARIPAYLWRAASSVERDRSLVIRVHGGPAAQAVNVWDGTIQLLLQWGFDVLLLNYRGSVGYGASFEQEASVEAQLADIVAARRFAENQLRIPRRRIALFGYSYGASLVIQTAMTEPNGFGCFVLAGVLAAEPRRPPTRGLRCLLVFQGSRDEHQTPIQARSYLEETFGREALTPPRGNFRVFAGEGHGFSRPSSWAELYLSIICSVGATRVGPYPPYAKALAAIWERGQVGDSLQTGCQSNRKLRAVECLCEAA
jgi:pimeloyl-ACP methyl ester carboxylesterase